MSGKTREKTHGQIAGSFGIVLFICLLDQISKLYAREYLQNVPTIPVINGIFHLTLTFNTGAAFGMLRGYPQIFTVISVIAVAAISCLIILRVSPFFRIEIVGLSMLLGGTIGNLIDRLRFGYVVDFIDLRVWPVFNLADSCITVGALVLGAALFFSERGRQVPVSEDRGSSGNSPGTS